MIVMSGYNSKYGYVAPDVLQTLTGKAKMYNIPLPYTKKPRRCGWSMCYYTIIDGDTLLKLVVEYEKKAAEIAKEAGVKITILAPGAPVITKTGELVSGAGIMEKARGEVSKSEVAKTAVFNPLDAMVKIAEAPTPEQLASKMYTPEPGLVKSKISTVAIAAITGGILLIALVLRR